jgi:hypothetical protein
MSKKLSPLDKINIAEPCSADWSEMRGNDSVRFCQHCQLSVNDISALTHKEAMKLVLKSKGHLCVRYAPERQNETTQTSSQHLYGITRRASRVAAGAFGAVLSLSVPALPQTSSALLDQPAQTQKQDEPIDAQTTDDEIVEVTGRVTTLVEEKPKKEIETVETQEKKTENSNPNDTAKKENKAEELTPEKESGEKEESEEEKESEEESEEEEEESDETEEEESEEEDSATVEAKQQNKIESGIVSATVVLVNQKTRKSFTTSTDKEGYYRFVNVKPGIYTLKIEADGFEKFSRHDMTLTAGNIKEDVQLAVRIYIMGAMAIVYNSPLVEAASEGDIKKVKSLLASGVDVNSKDKNYEMTALHVAVSNNNYELAKLLLYSGADPNLRSRSGEPTLMEIDADTSIELINLLLSHGADIDAQDDYGDTALMEAASWGNPSVLRLLIEQGAKVNDQNDEGETPLTKAVSEGEVECVQALLESGADVNIRNKKGQTALTLARESKDKEVLKLIKAYIAKK